MKEYSETFRDLTGGINLRDPAFRLRGGESPFLQNLTWRNGALRCRRGQVLLGRMLPGVLACAPALFHGWLVAHVQGQIRAIRLTDDDATAETAVGRQQIALYDPTLPRLGGTFFRWRDALYYKTRGAYLRVTWDARHDTLRGERLGGGSAYVPVIQRNTDPETGAGDLYQPENRLSPDKRVLFTAKDGVAEYRLPVHPVDAVQAVYVSGALTSRWAADLESGTVRFFEPPPQTDPPVNNTVEIRFRKENPEAFASVMDCDTAAVFGADRDLCVVLGGCSAQPNAWFWSGSGSLGMDPTYFPVSQYNLAGDSDSPITAFGKQQNRLVIFQSDAVGRADFSTEELNGRAQIAMDYTRINAGIGCDLPGSVQLVENNLVWCSRRHGVCRLENTSAALENNVRVLSRKLHGRGGAGDLLRAVRAARDTGVCSADTGERYLLIAGDEAFEWNYALSTPEDPGWFYHRGVRASGLVPAEGGRLFSLLPSGEAAEFQSVCMDFEGPIEKVYTLPPRSLGGLDRQKTVKRVLFVLPGDANTNTRVTYTGDFGRRDDATNLIVSAWRLSPRNLARRDLACRPFPRVFRRHPGFHNLYHLGVRLSNSEPGVDMPLISAEIIYTMRGRTR